MTRCESRPWRQAACVAALSLAGIAQAQDTRPFPATALRGDLRITQPPEVLLNGKPARLSPGSRIRGADNMLALSGTLAGQALVVNYTLDPLGLVHDVWVLTAAERARQPWPTTPAQAAAWRFDPGTQTWSKP